MTPHTTSPLRNPSPTEKMRIGDHAKLIMFIFGQEIERYIIVSEDCGFFLAHYSRVSTHSVMSSESDAVISQLGLTISLLSRASVRQLITSQVLECD